MRPEAPLSRTPPRTLLMLVALCAALAAGCASLPGVGVNADAVELATDAEPKLTPTTAQDLLQRAIHAAPPRQVKLQRARSLLEKLLAAEDADSRALQPHARALLQQIDERQRLGALNARLSQQLTRSNNALRDSKERNEKLQQQLDALTEIERSLATRAPVPVLPR